MNKSEFKKAILSRGQLIVNDKFICAILDGVLYKIPNYFIDIPFSHQIRILERNEFHIAWDMLYNLY